MPVPTSVGKGEGHLNLIAWEGYAQPQWVKPFEQETGCQVNAKYAGSSSEMVSLMANGGGGQYDMVSASGDADLRLIYGGDVQAGQHQPDPAVEELPPVPAEPAVQHDRRQALRRLLQFGPNVLLYSTKAFPTAPTSWSVLYDTKYKGQVTVPNNPIQIADAALYLSKTQPSLGITDPYELTQPQFNAAVNAAQAAAAADQEVLGPRPRRRSRCSRAATTVVGAAWPYQTNTLAGGRRQGRRHDPERGRDRLGRHLDARDQGAAPELRLQVDAVGDDAQGPGAAGDLLR